MNEVSEANLNAKQKILKCQLFLHGVYRPKNAFEDDDQVGFEWKNAPLIYCKTGFKQVACMDEYEHAQLSQETLLFVVASTFGNGESPENGASFAGFLQSIKNSIDARPLKNLR